MAGVDLLTVASLLGHRTLQMVKRYAHLAPEHQADAVARWVASRNQADTVTDTGAFGQDDCGTQRRLNVTNHGG